MTTTSTLSFLQDHDAVPKEMSDALDSEFDDPAAALRRVSLVSQHRAAQLAQDLQKQLSSDSRRAQLPSLLTLSADHPLHVSMACSDSIFHSLTKIASGGSQASQEIRQLEDAKRETEAHAAALAAALTLRATADQVAQALQAQAWLTAAETLQPWLNWKTLSEAAVVRTATSSSASPPSNTPSVDPRIQQYAGDYVMQQLQNAHAQLSKQVLELYKQSVQQGDLKTIGQLTPVLSLIQLDKEAVALYLQFLQTVLEPQLQQAVLPPEAESGASTTTNTPVPPFAPMARVYNVAVTILRHHLPMVSHCLYKAHGDVAVIQLIHAQVEQTVVPLFQAYQKERQFRTVSQQANRIYAVLEERYTGRRASSSKSPQDAFLDHHAPSRDEDDNDDMDDGGFSTLIGSLADVDATMDEAAVCLQNSESYLRFLHHSCEQVQQAQRLRWEREQQGKRYSQAREQEEEDFVMPEILSPMTLLHQTLVEVGGQYALIERCLLLASMQRAFVQLETDPRYYQPLAALVTGTGDRAPPQVAANLISSSSTTSTSSTNQALQTAMIDTCLYAARRSTQRAFATGHTETASAMTNFCVECLNDILLEVLSHRAEEFGVTLLKPGDGLLVGSAGIFNASSLIRQGAATVAVVQDTLVRKQQQMEGIAHACATMNDLEVAVHHIGQLETLLMHHVETGFAPGPATEQLQMCVKALRTVMEGYRIASNSTIESLESVLKPRIRSIVGEAVGAEGVAGFMMGSMSTGKGTDRGVMVRMNYNLDDDMYNLMQLSEGYVARLCSLLDELLEPLQVHLAPRLWDTLLLMVLGTVSKRLESSLRKCEFTSLGALALDTDIRDLLSYAKDHLYGSEYHSNQNITRACPPLSRLLQISKLLNVDDLEDVLDLISNSKRKSNWDLKLDDTKAFLCARVEFESSRVNELLRIPDED